MITKITGIDAAPSEVTITGAIPVTRIVPARPITNAPHQFVGLRQPAGLVDEFVVFRGLTRPPYALHDRGCTLSRG